MAKKTRKQRTYNRITKQDRAAAARSDAEAREADLVVQELEVRKLELIPEADRDGSWADAHGRAAERVAAGRAVVAATDASADAIGGAPQTAADAKERAKRVKAARVDRLRANIAAWESAMAGHERNLDRLEAVPAADRADWTGDLTGQADATIVAPGGQDTGQQALWDAAWDYNEAALDELERARDAALALIG